MNKYFICFTLLILPFSSFSEEDIESGYRKNYIEQMTPIMMKKMANAMPDESIEQNESVGHYPKEYWDEAIIPISKGENMSESLENFESYMSTQLEHGNISEEEIVLLLGTTKANLEICIKFRQYDQQG